LRRRVLAGRLGTVILFGPPYLDRLDLSHRSQMGGNRTVQKSIRYSCPSSLTSNCF
jgi:hypothetical protein